MVDRASRRKRITEERRAQILEAAKEVFVREGFATATVPEIARAAGVAAGTIYLYFPSKRELFVAAIRDLIITVPFLDLLSCLSQDNMDVVFGQIMQNRFDLIRSGEVTRMPVLIGEVIRDPELKAIWRRDFLEPVLTKMQGVYSALQSPGNVSRVEPPVAVRVVGGLVLGFLMIRIMEGEDSPLNSIPGEKVTADIVKFILHGLSGDMKIETKQEER